MKLKLKKEGVLLEKTALGFENSGVLNPAVIQIGNVIHLFYRAVKEGNFSSIGYAKLSNPTQVTYRSDVPVLFSQHDYESQGLEDPRISQIDGLYYLSYTAYDVFKASGQYLALPYTFTRSTDYIDIPVLVTLKPISMLTIQAGPQFSFLTKQTDVFNSTILTTQQQQDFSNDNYRKNLMSLTAGVGINLGKVVLDIRANYDLQQNNGNGTSTTPRYKNAWYQATIGFRIL